MLTCPNCGANVPEGAIACGNCGASLVSSQSYTSSMSQPASSGSSSTTWSSGNYDAQLSTRLEKALKKQEQLSRLIIGLSAVTLVLLLILIFG